MERNRKVKFFLPHMTVSCKADTKRWIHKENSKLLHRAPLRAAGWQIRFASAQTWEWNRCPQKKANQRHVEPFLQTIKLFLNARYAISVSSCLPVRTKDVSCEGSWGTWSFLENIDQCRWKSEIDVIFTLFLVTFDNFFVLLSDSEMLHYLE